MPTKEAYISFASNYGGIYNWEFGCWTYLTVFVTCGARIIYFEEAILFCTCLSWSNSCIYVWGRCIWDWNWSSALAVLKYWSDPISPCSFFSRQISPVDRIYDVGNQNFLALVLVLKEWHWVEGTSEAFLVWSDQKHVLPSLCPEP